MCPVIDADAQPVDQFATQPAADRGQADAAEREQVGQCRRIQRIIAPHEPRNADQQHDDHVDHGVIQADAFGAGVGGNMAPVHVADNGGHHTEHQPRPDHVERDQRPRLIAGHNTDQIEQQRRSQQTEREHDQNRVQRVTHYFDVAFHR